MVWDQVGEPLEPSAHGLLSPYSGPDTDNSTQARGWGESIAMSSSWQRHL
jgi:hypothetical protein